MHRLFAACAPGLEPWLRTEVAAAGGSELQVGSGGVDFQGDDRVLYRVALTSGLAIAVRIRLGTFSARRFEQVVRGISQLPWQAWLRRDDPVAVKVTTRKSRLYHTSAVAERVQAGLRNAVGTREGKEDRGWTVLVRLVNDQCTVSLDVAGEPLFRRGYRLATAKAPLRPDLAYALLTVSGWDRSTPVIDPFCGSGTLCIEAAAMARGLPPGRLRDFAFMQAPGFDVETWRHVQAEAMSGVRSEGGAAILGSDRDAGAIEAATENARRAGVSVGFEVASLGKAKAVLTPPGNTGLWVSNPPYGKRTGDERRLLNLYQSIGEHRRRMAPGWRLAMVVSDLGLARATRMELRSLVMTDHGGTKVHLLAEPRGNVSAESP